MDLQIFTSGGTIDKVYFDAKSEYTIGDPQIDRILEEALVTLDYEVEVLLQKDSLDMTEEDRKMIVRRIDEAECDRVLLTHGTDTMVETAQAIAEVVEGKTVVLVGSLQPARFRESDALFNIGFATAAVQAMPAGVYIAMNGRIFDPDAVRKNRGANRFEPTEA